jgi:iron complex outermembrane receptor protein
VITNSDPLLFVPDNDGITLGNIFVQDTFALADSLDVSLGVKAERDPYTGWNPMPDVRLAWRPNEKSVLWTAASRAIRAPTPFDRDVLERLGGIDYLSGNDAFEPEKMNAYEIGYRVQISDALALSASTFYDDYDDLRTIEINSPTQLLPLKWDNQMEGAIYGAEMWAKWQVADGWRLAPGGRWIKKHLRFSPGASQLVGLWQAGNDPNYQVPLNSSMDLRSNLTFDIAARYVDELPEPKLSAYYEVNAAINWQALRQLDVTFSGLNLLDARHQEYPSPAGEFIRRSLALQARWRF